MVKILLMLPMLLSAGLGILSAAPIAPRLLEVIPNGGLEAGETSFGRVLDFDDDEILVGSYQGAHVYDRSTNSHVRALGGELAADIGFGASVAISPEWYAVSSVSFHTGSVHIFRRSDGALVRTIPEPPGGPSESKFGQTIAIEGHRLFVFFHKYRAVDTDPHQGAVYVYDMRTWGVERIITSGEGVPFDGFGQSISVDGNTLVVGAPRKDEFTGTVYIFDVETGIRRAKIRVPVPAEDHWFGTAVLARGERVYATSRYGVWEYSAVDGSFLGSFMPQPAAGFYDWFGSDLEVTDSGLLVTWSRKGLYVFDAATRGQLEMQNNPFDDHTGTARPGPLKARGDVLLSSASGGTDPASKDGALLIYSLSASLPVVRIEEQFVSEAARRIDVPVLVDPPSAETVQIQYETAEDTAKERTDYTFKTGTLTIPAGSGSGSIRIPIRNDKLAESQERFYLRILSVTGAGSAMTDVPLHIENDDQSREQDVSAAANPASYAGDEFGLSLAAAGNRAFVGARNLDGATDSRGGVHVMNLKSKQIIDRIAPEGFAPDSFFGIGLAMDNNLLAVGALKSRENPAVPAVYFYNAKTLQEVGMISPPDSDHSDFGKVIAMRGNHIVLGMPYENKQGFGVGTCLVYDRRDFSFRYRLEPPEPVPGGLFGAALSIDRDNLAVGGDLRIFVADLNSGSFRYRIDSQDPGLDHTTLGFGESLAMQGPYLVAGNPGDDSIFPNSGSVLIFDSRNGQLLDTFRSGSGSSNFGGAVALDGKHLLVASGGQKDLHLMNLSTGAELLHYNLQLPPSGFFFGHSLAVTASHYVLATPNGLTSDQGLVFPVAKKKSVLPGF
jgi:DNA-binding beta-propeller fold protein YncE